MHAWFYGLVLFFTNCIYVFSKTVIGMKQSVKESQWQMYLRVAELSSQEVIKETGCSQAHVEVQFCFLPTSLMSVCHAIWQAAWKSSWNSSLPFAAPFLTWLGKKGMRWEFHVRRNRPIQAERHSVTFNDILLISNFTLFLILWKSSWKHIMQSCNYTGNNIAANCRALVKK